MKNQIEEKVEKFNRLEKELVVEIIQALKAMNCNMLKESLNDINKLNNLQKEELLNAIKIIESLKERGEILTKELRKEILNRTLLRTLDL